MPNFSLFQPETPSSDIFGPISRGSEHGTQHTPPPPTERERWEFDGRDLLHSELFKALLKGFEGLVWRLFNTAQNHAGNKTKASQGVLKPICRCASADTTVLFKVQSRRRRMLLSPT